MTASQDRPRRKRVRGSLLLIAGLFVVSATIRFGEGISLAFAAVGEGSSAPESCAPSEDTIALLRAVQERERGVAEREGKLADRKQALDLVEKRIQDRLASLVAAENELSKTVSIADKAAEQDIQRLVTVYENMKPREAAPLFEAMAPDFAAGFLARMRPESAAAVMANLNPEFAYSISVIVAGRNARAPSN
ncbi:MotE family protein [Paenirhodobacter sp.]|uniref:MotE family protein n=1 Tax=Paenirhodobacter sp. TaxID=1965326 RepID=UPI003B402876